MKKLFNKYSIFMFTLGTLISGITVYAFTIGAGDVTFSPKNNKWDVNNVETALNNLYDRSSGVHNLIDETMNRSTFSGVFMAPNNVVLNLNKGYYYVFGTISHAYRTTSMVNNESEIDLSSIDIQDATCEKLDGYWSVYTPSTKADSSAYVALNALRFVMKCYVEESASISYNITTNTPKVPSLLELYSLKIEE